MSFKKAFKNLVGDVSGVKWKDLDHKKVYMAGAVAVAVVILIIILIVKAVGSGSTKEETAENIETPAAQQAEEVTDDNPLETNAYPEVNDVVTKYFASLASGDLEVLEDVVDVLEDDEKKVIETKKDYIESYDNIICYTKKGLEEGSYIVFAYYEMNILSIDTPAPGMLPLYVCQYEDGSYYVYNGEASEELQNYVLELTANEDVAAVIADVENKYQAALASDSALAEFQAKIQQTTSEEAAEEPAEEPAEVAEEASAEESAEEEVPAEEPAEVAAADEEELAEPVRMQLNDTVKIRADRSTDSERVANGYKNEFVTVYANYSDGWSKVDYNGTSGYCKTEFLTSLENGGTVSTSSSTKMQLNDTVRIRADRSADSARVATGYKNEFVTVYENYSDGWSRVDYNGTSGYCQTQYLSEI